MQYIYVFNRMSVAKKFAEDRDLYYISPALPRELFQKMLKDFEDGTVGDLVFASPMTHGFNIRPKGECMFLLDPELLEVEKSQAIGRIKRNI